MSTMLGRTVRFLREQAGVRQAHLAYAAGWNAPALNRFERHGIWPADPSKLEELLKVLAGLKELEQVNRASDIWRMAVQGLQAIEGRAEGSPKTS